jgi:integrase
MEREGLQQDGGLYLQGGFWRLHLQDSAIDPNRPESQWRRPLWIGPATGPERLTKEQAQQIAWENFLSRPARDTQPPEAAMTIGDFVENVFVPEHVATKGLAGRTHYQAILKHVLAPEEVNRVFRVDTEKSPAKLKAVPNWPYLGRVRLCDARPDDIQRLMSAALERGYSTQTVTHIRNVVLAVFSHARKKQWFLGDNPARLVALPGMTRKEGPALTLAQAKEVLGVMRHPEKEMTLIAIFTNMNMAEICGLQWKHVNLTESWFNAGDAPVPPRTIAVRKQWFLGELGSVRGGRNIDVPIPEPLLPILLGLSRRPKCTGPDDFVLVSRAGTPVNANCVAARRLKPIGKELKIPNLSWNVFRRTRSALAHELGMQAIGDRVATGG